MPSFTKSLLTGLPLTLSVSAMVALSALVRGVLPAEGRAMMSPQTATIAGRVVDDSTGGALAGAYVAIRELPNATVTDSAGRFRLSGLPPGDRELTATKIGYQSATRSVAALAASEERVVDIRLPRHPAVMDGPSPYGVEDVRVHTVPAPPRQGALLRLLLEVPLADSADARRDSVMLLSGRLAGEPIHFRRDSSGWYSGFAAMPVDAPDSVSLRLTLAHEVVTDGAGGLLRARPVAREVRLPVAKGGFKMEKLEKLTVAPRFSQKPDSALAARIARESARARAVSERSHDTPRLWSEPFLLPRESRITSAFGSGREFNGEVQSRHMGTDLAGATGAPIHAANRGVVALVDEFYLAGNVVYLDHGKGLVTAYFHLSATEVAVGDTVQRGQRIGLVGATGRVTGPHLHWVARYGGISVDPLSVVALTRDTVP